MDYYLCINSGISCTSSGLHTGYYQEFILDNGLECAHRRVYTQDFTGSDTGQWAKMCASLCLHTALFTGTEIVYSDLSSSDCTQ